MKRLKIILSLLVVTVMLLSMSFSAFAWKTYNDRYPESVPAGTRGQGGQKFVDKGLPAPLVDAPVSHAIEGRINISINGEYEYFTEQPLNVEGRILLPFRELFEFFNLKVTWNDTERKASAENEGNKIEITVDNTKAYVNSEEKTLDVPAKIINGRCYVPVRFVAEALNYDVYWNDGEQTVRINNKSGGES